MAGYSLSLRGVTKAFGPGVDSPKGRADTRRSGAASTRNEELETEAGDGAVVALADVELTVPAGQFAVIVGANGSGKTTLLRLVAGDFPPTSGTIAVRNGATEIRWTDMPAWERASGPAPTARVQQDPRAGTVGGMTVLENVRLYSHSGRVPSPVRFGLSRDEMAAAREGLTRVGLGARLRSRAAELSGGQRQILALFLATLRRPAFLLLDEHTASLDRNNARRCLAMTDLLAREAGTTVLMVTHNLADALAVGDRLLVLRDGRITADFEGDAKRNLTLPALLDLCGYADL